MSPPQFEVELVAARAAFNEALEDSAPGLPGAAERYGALLDEYMGRLRRHSRSAPAAGPTRGHPSSLGAASGGEAPRTICVLIVTLYVKPRHACLSSLVRLSENAQT